MAGAERFRDRAGEQIALGVEGQQTHRRLQKGTVHALAQSRPLAVKERVPVWDDPGPTLRLMKGIKERLDPIGILNPGRFVGGI